jgi:hypothetical protein
VYTRARMQVPRRLLRESRKSPIPDPRLVRDASADRCSIETDQAVDRKARGEVEVVAASDRQPGRHARGVTSTPFATGGTRRNPAPAFAVPERQQGKASCL